MAVRLCLADQAAIFLREGDLYRLAANWGFPAGLTRFKRVSAHDEATVARIAPVFAHFPIGQIFRTSSQGW